MDEDAVKKSAVPDAQTHGHCHTDDASSGGGEIEGWKWGGRTSGKGGELRVWHS